MAITHASVYDNGNDNGLEMWLKAPKQAGK